MQLKLLAALAAATILSSAADAATINYNFVVAPILGTNGQPLRDNGNYLDGRTFVFTIGADETPNGPTSLNRPEYRAKSYTYYEFGSTTPVVVPAQLGRNIAFFATIDQGGLALTNGGVRNFRVFGDDSSEVLYDEAAYRAALLTNPAAQPVFKLGTFTLSTYPRNGSFNPQPIQNYTVTITDADAAAAVPEPATWAMMIAGFGLVGAAARRRRTVVSA